MSITGLHMLLKVAMNFTQWFALTSFLVFLLLVICLTIAVISFVGYFLIVRVVVHLVKNIWGICKLSACWFNYNVYELCVVGVPLLCSFRAPYLYACFIIAISQH